MKMEHRHLSKNPAKSHKRMIDFDHESTMKWNNLGKNLNDFWEDLFEDIVE